MPSSRVITLDPSRQKLLIPPNEPLPKFYPTPRVLMVTPIYDTRELSQGTYSSGSPRDFRAWDPRRSDDGYASSERSGTRGVYTDSEWEDARRRDRDTRSRTPRRHDHRHRSSLSDESGVRSNLDSEASYERHRQRGASHDYSERRERPHRHHEVDGEDGDEPDEEYSSEDLPRDDGYGTRSRLNGQFSVPYHNSTTGHVNSQGHVPSHGYTTSQHNFNGYTPSHPQSQASHQSAPNPQQLMVQLGQQAPSSHPSHNGKLHKRGFFGDLAQSALGHSLSQGQNQPYSQHTPSNTQSQHPGNDPLAGMHLPPATRALLHYAQEKGILDDLARYFKVIPPHPNFSYSRCTGRKKAVCVGINYVGQRDELKGCANDARNMRDFLIKNYGFKDQDILLLLDDSHGRGSPRPTRKEMFHAMAWLINNAQPHDSLFFHYSGHGGQSPDASGKEVDGMDEVIFPVDYNENSRRDEGPADIIDDELHEALVHDLPAGVRLTAVFDSCHSGTVLDLPYLHSAHGRLRSMGHVSKRAKERGGADAADVICFAACRDDEKSADTREGGVPVGAMSYAFIQALERNRNQTYEELLQHLRATLIPKYHQKAQISGTHPVDLQRQFLL